MSMSKKACPTPKSPGKYKRGTPMERFTRSYVIDPDTGCWIWQMCTNGGGAPGKRSGNRHPQFGTGSYTPKGHPENKPARQWGFEQHKGIKIPKHARLYPMCGNDLCVNPDHMSSHRFVCKNGHALGKGSVIWEKSDSGLFGWTRRCMACNFSNDAPDGVFVVNLD